MHTPTYMKRLRLMAVAVPLAIATVLTGCDTLTVTDPNNPGIQDLENPTLRDLQLLAQGVIIGARGAIATRAGYVSTLGILGRESYNFDPSDPRFLTGLLEGPLDGSSNAFGGGHWVPRYANVRNANILIASIDRAPSGSVTSEQGEALRGFAKTMAAHDLLLAINTRDDFGAPIDVAGEDPTGDPPPIVPKDDVLAEVVRLLNEGAGHLSNGGSSFPFVMPSGFSRFDTPAAFREFNQAIMARAQAYRGNWSEVTTSLQGSFIDDVLLLGVRSLERGVYHSYSAGPGDVVNNLFDPSRLIIVAHPSVRDEAQSGDARLARKIVDIEPVSDQASRGVTTDIAFDIYDALSAGVPYIRNEELILLRAEARLQTNDLPGSLADINLIRTVSGSLPPITQSEWDSRSATDRLNELLYNRRYSLLFEGHRWIDLRRYDRLDTLPIDAGTSFVRFSRFPFPVRECDARVPAPSQGCSPEVGF